MKLDKKRFLLVLASVLLSSAILSTQFVTPTIGKVSHHTVMQSAVHAKSFGEIETVSVAYNSNIKSYPGKNESPYGPDVNPTYDLVEQALVYLNPENPENPLSNIVMPGDVVVLKPNFVSPSGFEKEGCTRPPILRPLVDFSVKAGASKVIIAEGPSSPDPENVVFGPDYSNVTGLVQVLQEMYPSVNITYKNLNQDPFTWIDLGENSTFYGAYTADQLYSLSNIRMDEDSYYYAEDSKGYNPKGYQPGLYAIANTVLEADVFINVPKMKVHHLTGVTLSMKNLIGITVSSTGNMTNEQNVKDIPHWNNTAVHYEDLTRQDSFENDVVWRVIADLNKIVFYADKDGAITSTKQRRYLSVVDGVVGMEGPTVYSPPGVPRPTGVIIAGQNPVGVDAVCCRVMGFNFTVLGSVVNMEQISDHPIGKPDPTAICVVGASLNSQIFGEPYVPHFNYEDSEIAPYKIRLQYFDPPRVELIKAYPETPREGAETKVIVYAQNIDLVAAGWLRYSLDGADPIIVKMVPSGETMIGNLGLLEGGMRVSYDVCLQDYFFNTVWSDKISIFVGSLEVFSVFWDEVEYQVTIISNSTVTDFNFSQPESQISFNVTSPSEMSGFCNITIPIELLDGSFTFEIDDVSVVDCILTQNATHSSIYLTYNHGTHTVSIKGTTVIPEFPILTLLPLFMTATLVAVILRKRPWLSTS